MGRRTSAGTLVLAIGLSLYGTNEQAGAQSARQWRIAVIGDSLSTGYGLRPEQAYPNVLQEYLRQSGWSTEIRTFGEAGNTTADGVASAREARDWEPHVTIVAVAANDGLRQLRTQQVEYNLRRIIDTARETGSRVILTGMRAPPRHGPDYGRRFDNVFYRLADDTRVQLVPFLLSGVAGVPSMNQADRVHPNQAGAEHVAAGLWPYVNDLLTELTGR